MFMKLKKINRFKLFFIIFCFYPLTSVYALPNQPSTLKRCDAFKYEEAPIDTDFPSVNNITDQDIMMSPKTIEKQNFQPKTNLLGKWLHQGFHLSIDCLELTNKILDLINHIS